MMRTLLAATGAAVLCAAAAAQSPSSSFHPITAPVRNAGTVSLLTGVWTPSGSQLPASANVIYNNTCTWTGGVFYGGVQSCEDKYDYGRIPSSGAPGAPPGAVEANFIASFQFAYCTYNANPFPARIAFWNNLRGQCAGGVPPTPPPAHTSATRYFDLTALNLPGSTTTGFIACWTVTVDTTGTGFTLLSDGDGIFDDNQALDLFTWSFTHSNPSQPGGPEGLVISGDPLAAAPGTCTYNITCGTDPFSSGPCGTGLGTLDDTWINVDNVAVGDSSTGQCPGGVGPILGTNCYFFGGYPTNPFASHWLKVESDGGGALCPAPAAYCTAKTSSSGCVPSIGSTGTPSPTGNFRVLGSSIEGAQLGVLFHSFAGPAGQPFQGGFLCVSPPVSRLPAQGSGGTAGTCTGAFSTLMTGLLQTVPAAQNVWVQYWFRDPASASGTGLSNALHFVTCP